MKKNYLSNKYFILAKSFLYGMGTFVLVGFLLSLPMMLLWNWLMPFIFGLPELTILQTFGFSMLVNMFTTKLDINTDVTGGVSNLSNIPSLAKKHFDLRNDLEEKLTK